MGLLTLVLGGIRSGKSEFAERLGAGAGRHLLYVATSVAGDDEMRDRIKRHRERRSDTWTTIEAPLALAGALSEAGRDWDAVLVESVSGWVANLLLQSSPVEEPAGQSTRVSLETAVSDGIDDLLAWQRSSHIYTVLVTDEVGLSLVSTDPAGRRFQDLMGSANQRLASEADEVYLVSAGLPLQLKGPARTNHRPHHE
jgi:adenosylcobinamide kinase/adenosylcobinamide-phosphate guanylyltransferase